MSLRRHFPQWRVIAPDLPVDPFEAMELLRKTIDKEQPKLVIGTSMGGMYTQQLWGMPRIVVNPSFEMSRTLRGVGSPDMFAEVETIGRPNLWSNLWQNS